MKILVVDDETPARQRLRSMITELAPSHEVVGEAANGLEALELCHHNEVDLLLVDIRMPGMDGLELAAELTRLHPPPAVIFTTAYDEHALEAFEKQAVDYLLKPIRRPRLEQALQKASALTRAQLQLIDSLHQPTAEQFVTFSLGGRLHRIPLSDVHFFRADQKYVTVSYKGGEGLLEESLRSLEERLGDNFMRIHRNALVAKRVLCGLSKSTDGQVFACLEGSEQELEVSRRHLPEVRKWLKSGHC